MPANGRFFFSDSSCPIRSSKITRRRQPKTPGLGKSERGKTTFEIIQDEEKGSNACKSISAIVDAGPRLSLSLAVICAGIFPHFNNKVGSLQVWRARLYQMYNCCCSISLLACTHIEQSQSSPVDPSMKAESRGKDGVSLGSALGENAEEEHGLFGWDGGVSFSTEYNDPKPIELGE